MALSFRARAMHWTAVPCLPFIPESMRYTSGCPWTEGDEKGEYHTHWVDKDGNEVVTDHKRNEPEYPNCVLRPQR